jgi:IS605 OrfB family transposase
MFSVHITYKFRIKDSSAARHLRRYAWGCNQIWNFCCQIQREAESRWNAGRHAHWPSAFDLINLCSGASADLGITAEAMSAICRQFAISRSQQKKCPRFRASGGPKRALGWLPFPARGVNVAGDRIRFRKRDFYFWKSREIAGTIKAGAFVEDARGRWYVTFQCEVEDTLPTGTGQVGIDLGLKTLAVCTDGTEVPALRHYRRYEVALAVAQRANNKRRVRAIHAKVTNARRHQLHVASTKIARENELIVVGNVNAAKLAKTRFAKSVLDASWSMFRNQLRYKASRHGARYVEADERWTSQACSGCGAIGGPKGIAGLGVRHWECSSCGEVHDRDLNAAKNILRVGAERRPPEVEIAV